MSLSSLINPKCNVPLFVLGQNDAEDCGMTNGYICATLLTIVILIILGILIYRGRREVKTEQEQKQEEYITPQESGVKFSEFIYVTGALLIIGLSWYYLPGLSRWFYLRSWQGYDAQIQSYMTNGLSRQDAINKVQDIYQTQIQANAIESAGRNISRSMRSRGYN